MAQPLCLAEISAALLELPEWRFENDALVKVFQFSDFKQAMSFMQLAGFQAEAMDHHPDWTNVYNRVSVRLNTHSAGGKVTIKDLRLAQALEGVATGK